VEHWLADEPVTAYREPWTARARRWGRRHRALVTGLAAALLMALLLGGGGWWWLEQQRQEREAAVSAEVNKALEETVRYWGEARKARPGELGPWQEALSAAKRANGLLAGGEGTPELRKRADDLWEALTAEERAARQAAEEVKKDRHFLKR